MSRLPSVLHAPLVSLQTSVNNEAPHIHHLGYLIHRRRSRFARMPHLPDLRLVELRKTAALPVSCDHWLTMAFFGVSPEESLGLSARFFSRLSMILRRNSAHLVFIVLFICQCRRTKAIKEYANVLALPSAASSYFPTISIGRRRVVPARTSSFRIGMTLEPTSGA